MSPIGARMIPCKRMPSEEHRLLTTLRDSQLKDNEARQTFYRKVIDSLDMGDSSYLLLLACDNYDVPHRGKDDSLQADASDEVFTYIVCVVCPIKEGKVEIGARMIPCKRMPRMRCSPTSSVLCAPSRRAR